MDNNKQVEVLKQMYDLHIKLLEMSGEELVTFREQNGRLVQNLVDALSY
jgi:hypothetical protein